MDDKAAVNTTGIVVDTDYFQKLYDDLIQQFKGKANITIFQKAIARQLQEVHAFFYELRIMRWLQTAEGMQLDGIGNIVDLSRTDALIWANMAGQNVPMDDDLYRLYLWFKIFLNTSDGTYADVARTLEKFRPDVPFYYSEHIEVPATMFFTSAPMPMTTDLRILRIATRVKAAGVSLHFIMQVEANETADHHASAVSVFAEAIIFDNPVMGGETVDYDTSAVNIFADILILDNPVMGGITETKAAASANIFMEVKIPE